MIRKLLIFMYLMQNTAIADISVSDNSFNESYSESVEVSGEFLKGIQIDSESDVKSLHVIFPENSKGTLCVVLSSIDGKYKGELRHTILEPVSGLTKINFNSKYKNFLREYKNREIAVLAGLKKTCDQSGFEKIFISSWNSDAVNDVVFLIRSSARKDMVYMPNKENSILSSKCKKIRESYNVSYDKYCVLKGVDLVNINGVEIIRKNLQPIETEIIGLN